MAGFHCIWMSGRGYINFHLSPLADIDKKKRAKHTSPSYGVNWEFSLFEDDVHNHVKKCELKEKNHECQKEASFFMPENNLLSSHMKRLPLLDYIINGNFLSLQKNLKWNGLVLHWYLIYNKQKITWPLGDMKFLLILILKNIHETHPLHSDTYIF